MTTQEKDLKFWSFVIHEMKTYNVRQDTAEAQAVETLGYKPKYAFSAYY